MQTNSGNGWILKIWRVVSSAVAEGIIEVRSLLNRSLYYATHENNTAVTVYHVQNRLEIATEKSKSPMHPRNASQQCCRNPSSPHKICLNSLRNSQMLYYVVEKHFMRWDFGILAQLCFGAMFVGTQLLRKQARPYE